MNVELETPDNLKQVTGTLKIGRLVEARQILEELILREPDNAVTWQLFGGRN
jgi:predicted Zn-dependent protease